jgi:hypothetical protein
MGRQIFALISFLLFGLFTHAAVVHFDISSDSDVVIEVDQHPSTGIKPELHVSNSAQTKSHKQPAVLAAEDYLVESDAFRQRGFLSVLGPPHKLE